MRELGHGFAFFGRQYHFEVGEQDFYIDLLFGQLGQARFRRRTEGGKIRTRIRRKARAR
ncbi:DUF1016 domain-containing protein [Rhodococcus sp. ARC_M6]|nr:PDDEXK nuclease domain-containing protein [Rhodococcus sp. ARC_M6]MCJ0907057.1 DUF1016 domain-containing protein [Rhodococcus sp. ARC_M6]